MLITDLKQLEGKTIERVSDDQPESMGLKFTDGTCAFLYARFFGECHELELDDSPDDYQLMRVGAITEAEYQERLEAMRQESEDRQRRQELDQLDRLKAKYES